MRLLVIGDLHARPHRLDEFTALAEALERVAARESPDAIVLTGDLLHEHARVHTAALNAVLDLIRTLSGMTKALFLLVGNHDLSSNRCFLEDKHAFNAVKAWPGVVVVDRVVHDSARRLVLVPYVPPGRFIEALSASEVPWRGARAILAHQDFRGARQGTYVSTGGDAWHADWPLVISGHFHTHQWPKPNLCYVGAPVAHDFGDSGDQTISLFTWMTDGALDRAREDRIDLGLPRRRTVELPLSRLSSFVPPDGDHVRLIVSGSGAELAAFRRSPDYRMMGRQVSKLMLRVLDQRGQGVGRRSGSYRERLAELIDREPPAVKRLFEELTCVST